MASRLNYVGPMHFHSIAHAGMKIFDAPIERTIGSIEVDLVSAPIEPGEHRLVVDGAIGGIQIYLPSYVKFTVEGGAAIGGQDVHEHLPVWTRLCRSLRAKMGLSNKLPDSAPPDPGVPISITFVINHGIGGLDVYRM